MDGEEGKARGYLSRLHYSECDLTATEEGKKGTQESSSCTRWVERIEAGVHEGAATRKHSRFLHEPGWF